MTVRKTNGVDVGVTNRSGSFDASAMSLTYSDFVYPQTQLTDEQDGVDLGSLADSFSQHLRGSSSNLSWNGSSYLPNEFQVIQEPTVPLLQNLDEADQDFIIISEFSEIEGPIPICTIPSNAPEKTDINLNSFAVHLMSTDYQVNTVGQFGICEDTQVLRTNVFQGVHVAMQYFTLYDIKARGFVRPFCFGYISKDHIKLERMVTTLLEQFTEITKILKYTNRVWFMYELTEYLKKLRTAKEDYINRSNTTDDAGTSSYDMDPLGLFPDSETEGLLNEDSETISLNQIAQQYSEIENILQTVKDSLAESSYYQIAANLQQPTFSTESKLKAVFAKLEFLGNSFDSLDIPLVHPLKQKAESLRPMTTLGQYGTAILVQDLMRIHEQNQRDLLFTEMDTLTEDFRNHFRLAKGLSKEPIPQTPSLNLQISENDDEICRILETIHASVPIVTVDTRSGSYHSLSTEESDLASTPTQINGDEISFRTASGSAESILFKATQRTTKILSETPSSSSPSGSTSSSCPPVKNRLQEFLCRTDMNSSWTIIEPRQSISGPSDEGSPLLRIPAIDEEPIEIQKMPWWSYAAKTKLQKGDPGYAIRKFWVHFPKVAHHILYSILIGRPIIFFGNSKFRPKVIQIIKGLVPFIPSFPAPSFKILHWHQGILVPDHLNGKFKLIGLCIPELAPHLMPFSIHDLLGSRDQNSVTLLDVEQKRIFGPAYLGNYFKAFETVSIPKRFLDDLSLLTYLGSILTEIETQVYMVRSLQEGKGDSSLSKIMKELDLKNSDLEIVKYLSALSTEVEEAVNLF